MKSRGFSIIEAVIVTAIVVIIAILVFQLSGCGDKPTKDQPSEPDHLSKAVRIAQPTWGSYLRRSVDEEFGIVCYTVEGGVDCLKIDEVEHHPSHWVDGAPLVDRARADRGFSTLEQWGPIQFLLSEGFSFRFDRHGTFVVIDREPDRARSTRGELRPSSQTVP